MLNVSHEIREGLIANFGRNTANTTIELLNKVIANTGQEAHTFLDRIVYELSKQIPEIQYRYQRLTQKSKEPIERLNLLLYIIRSIKMNESSFSNPHTPHPPQDH